MPEIPGALADPLGVAVDLVTGIEPALDRAVLEDAVTSVAGGRAKRRRLARALLDRPALLADGRSPAPRVVGDLLIALRNAGAVNISPPVCAECGKHLRNLQRRGEDWYCAVCGPRPEPCSVCGNLRRVATRDRSGQPRCAQCPDEDSRDPVTVITTQVTALEPDADPEVIAAAVRQAAPRPSHQQRLAWALESNTELLTGAGHRAPIPAVLRLIDLLNDGGITGVVRPACPRCHRIVRISKPLDGQRVCRGCIAKSRIEQCTRCGAQREPATRDEQGRSVCPNCLVTDPVNRETCLHCGRRRRVGTRTPHGPLCPSCPPLPTLACSICGQRAPCGISRLTGRPWCWACQKRSAGCTGCGQVKPIRSGTVDEPLCDTCTVPAFRLDCPTCCGTTERIRPGQCPDCRLDRRLAELLTGPDGAIHPALHPLNQALSATGRPVTVLRWLAKDLVSTLLTDLAAGRRQLTHQTLDSLPPSPALAHLRSVLVATGALPPRDEQMVRLEHILDDILTGRDDPDQRQLLHRYAIWHLLRRLRGRNSGADTTHEQFAVVRQQVRAAVVLLDWLATQDLTLATCRQADLDRWLSGNKTSHRQQAGHFVRWAAKQHLTDLVFPATRWQGPTRALDDQARWEAARRLLHDDTIKIRDRLAGLLILLYAQHTATISRLTVDHVETDGGTVRLRLGATPITLPDPVADLTLQILASQRGHATIGANEPSPWLFPGGQPGRPINASHLGQRLKALGIQPGRARSTALFQLATELPAAVLARTLGIHIAVAVAWQRASSGDWASYAADVSRRTDT
jgi:hypothetical protein